MRFLAAVILTLASMATLASGQSETTTCPLDCQNEAPCVEGKNTYAGHPQKANGSPFDFLAESTRDNHFCDCPANFTGIRCGRSFVECEGSSGHYCYHGGKCLENLSEDPIPDDQLFCDCNDAAHDGISYVGKYCEMEGALTCDATSDEFFCLNGAPCKDGFETKLRPCECGEGYRGPHCEFEDGAVPSCDLECAIGECQLGIKDYDTAIYTEFWATHEGYMHCACPDGFFGLQCEIAGDQCGSNHCFNGAACLETMNVAGQTTYACDCRTAATADSSFAGDYCQSESTQFCHKTADHNGHLFCTNGGTCRKETHKGCDCLTGFHGPMCEFRDTEFLEKNCTLSCDNKGECRTGMKDISLISQFGSDLEDFNQTHTDTWEHCVCPDGYFGVQCEHELEICPGPNPHVCLHGSKCVAQDETTSLSHSCNCDAGFDSIEKHAGKFCQYTSTAICTKNGQPGVGKANFAFCVNSGTCKAQVEDNESHPGCICDEEFAGDHCEFLKVNVPNPVTPGESSNVANNPSVQSSNSNDVAIIVFGVVLGAIFAAIALVLVQKRKQGKKDFSVGTNIPPTHPTAEKELSGMAVFDSDVEEVIIDFPGIKGNKTMETVEII